MYSYSSTTIQSRLDMWFISKDLIPITKETKIQMVLTDTDHKAVTVLLKGSKIHRRGPGMYEMNTEILEEKEYETIIKQAIQVTKQANEDDEDALYTWGEIKAVVKNKSKQYSMIRATIHRQREERLRDKLASLERELHKLEKHVVDQ